MSIFLVHGHSCGTYINPPGCPTSVHIPFELETASDQPRPRQRWAAEQHVSDNGHRSGHRSRLRLVFMFLVSEHVLMVTHQVEPSSQLASGQAGTKPTSAPTSAATGTTSANPPSTAHGCTTSPFSTPRTLNRFTSVCTLPRSSLQTSHHSIKQVSYQRSDPSSPSSRLRAGRQRSLPALASRSSQPLKLARMPRTRSLRSTSTL
jgi:hypothetical protein